MIQKAKLTLIFLSILLVYYFSMLAQEHSYTFFMTTALLVLYFMLMVLIDSEIVNPISILFPFILGFYYYQFMLSDKQTELVDSSIYALFLFIIFYLCGSFLALIKKDFFIGNTNLKHDFKSVYVAEVIFYIGVSIFIIECLATGGFPFFIALFYKVNIYDKMVYLPVLHYFVMLTAIFPSVFYFLYKSNRVSLRKFVVISCIVVFILLNIMSRQIFILSIVFTFFTYIKVNGVSANKYILKLSLFAGVLFLVLGFVRIQSINSDVSQLVYLKVVSEVPIESDANTFDVTFNLYATQNIETFNDMVKKVDIYGHGFGKYTLQSLFKLLKFDELFGVEYIVELDSFSRLGSIVADPYLDFGLVGVLFFGFLYGFFNSLIFLKAKYVGSIRYTFCWAMVCYIMIMSVFTNFYNVLFSWLIFLFVYFITLKAETNK